MVGAAMSWNSANSCVLCIFIWSCNLWCYRLIFEPANIQHCLEIVSMFCFSWFVRMCLCCYCTFVHLPSSWYYCRYCSFSFCYSFLWSHCKSPKRITICRLWRWFIACNILCINRCMLSSRLHRKLPSERFPYCSIWHILDWFAYVFESIPTDSLVLIFSWWAKRSHQPTYP